MRRNVVVEDVAAMQLERRRRMLEEPVKASIRDMDRSFLAVIALALVVSAMAIWMAVNAEVWP